MVKEKGRGTGCLLLNLADLGELIYDWEPLELKPRNSILIIKKWSHFCFLISSFLCFELFVPTLYIRRGKLGLFGHLPLLCFPFLPLWHCVLTLPFYFAMANLFLRLCPLFVLVVGGPYDPPPLNFFDFIFRTFG